MSNRTAKRYQGQAQRAQVERDEARREVEHAWDAVQDAEDLLKGRASDFERLQKALDAAESRHAADSETWTRERHELREAIATAREALHSLIHMLRSEMTGSVDEGLRNLNCNALVDLTIRLGRLLGEPDNGTATDDRPREIVSPEEAAEHLRNPL